MVKRLVDWGWAQRCRIALSLVIAWSSAQSATAVQTTFLTKLKLYLKCHQEKLGSVLDYWTSIGLKMVVFFYDLVPENTTSSRRSR